MKTMFQMCQQTQAIQAFLFNIFRAQSNVLKIVLQLINKIFIKVKTPSRQPLQEPVNPNYITGQLFTDYIIWIQYLKQMSEQPFEETLDKVQKEYEKRKVELVRECKSQQGDSVSMISSEQTFDELKVGEKLVQAMDCQMDEQLAEESKVKGCAMQEKEQVEVRKEELSNETLDKVQEEVELELDRNCESQQGDSTSNMTCQDHIIDELNEVKQLTAQDSKEKKAVEKPCIIKRSKYFCRCKYSCVNKRCKCTRMDEACSELCPCVRQGRCQQFFYSLNH